MGGLGQIFDRVAVVAGRTFRIDVTLRQFILGFVIRHGSLFDQVKGLFKILGHHKTAVIGIAHHILCGDVAAFRRLLQQFDDSVVGNAARRRSQINESKVDRRFLVAEFGRLVKHLNRLVDVLFGADAAVIKAAEVIDRNHVLLGSRHRIIAESLFLVAGHAVFAVKIHVTESQTGVNVAFFRQTGHPVEEVFLGLIRFAGKFLHFLFVFKEREIQKRKHSFVVHFHFFLFLFVFRLNPAFGFVGHGNLFFLFGLLPEQINQRHVVVGRPGSKGNKHRTGEKRKHFRHFKNPIVKPDILSYHIRKFRMFKLFYRLFCRFLPFGTKKRQPAARPS